MSTQYHYNLDRKLIEIVRPDGEKITFDYKPSSGLLNLISTSFGTYNYSYKPNSNLISKISSPDQENLEYKYLGNIVSQVTATGPVSSSVSYAYNSDGSLSDINVLGGVNENFTYDNDGFIKSAGSEVFTRNDFGAVSTASLGILKETITYNDFGEVLKDQFKSNGKSIYSFKYTRDKFGRVFTVDETFTRSEPKNFEYKYNDRGQLAEVFRNGELLRSYRYDQNGNRKVKKLREHEIKATYDDQDRLLTYGDLEFRYNANGDLISKIEKKNQDSGDDNDRHPLVSKNTIQKTTKYKYDVFGNLKFVELPTHQVIEYIIDGQSRRVGKKIDGKFVQGFVYQNQTKIIAELDSTGKIAKQFVYGEKSNIPDYMIYKGKEFRIISDQVGTPKVIVDSATGEVIEKFDFDEFGILLDKKESRKSLIPFGFAGGIKDDDTNLVRMGARDYEPIIGRWLSKDPIRFGARDSNLYGYVANDPVNFNDPSGFTREDVMRAISIASREYSSVSGINPIFMELGGDTVGRTVFGILGPEMQIDSLYLGELNDSQKISLLNTVLHESKHYQDGFWGTFVGEISGGWNKRIGDWQYHIDIYNKSELLTEKYKNEYLCGK